MYKIKIFKDVGLLPKLEEKVNDFLSSDEFKNCVIITTEYKPEWDTFVITYFNRARANLEGHTTMNVS